jgi:hypothetical protein
MKIDKVVKGLIRYVDETMMPSFSDNQQTLYLIACEMATQYPETVLNLINNNFAVKVFLSPDKDGNLNVDRAISILKATAKRKEKIVLSIPKFGDVTFREEDFDEIHRYIKEADR